MKKSFAIPAVLLSILILFVVNIFRAALAEEEKVTTWPLQSIDTVKYSRDVARDRGKDPAFEKEIDLQVKKIAEAGATHISIGTPYDEEFYPFLKRWVSSARKYGLRVWYRGNFSGWENWFGYSDITKEEHLNLLKKFISDNKDLFAEGDIFTPCPECENGGPGDPRITGDVESYRKFLIDEYKTSSEAFRLAGKNVSSNYFSMNGDVAKLIMDKETTKALGGIVVIDHYVDTPEKLVQDIQELTELSGGSVVIGEIGVPIPDIHGQMTEDQRSQWLKDAFTKLSKVDQVVGVNYWTGFGGSTQLWDSGGNDTLTAGVVRSFFKPLSVYGKVVNEIGLPVKNANVVSEDRTVLTNSKGEFGLPIPLGDKNLTVEAEGYETRKFLITTVTEKKNIVILQKIKEDILFKVLKFFYQKIISRI